MATDWVILGTEKMRVARRKMRLSSDGIALRMARNGEGITPRTYLRWEAKGEVPRDKLPVLATVLGLNLEQILIDQPTRVQWQQVGEVLAQVVAAVQDLTQLAEELRIVAAELRQAQAAHS